VTRALVTGGAGFIGSHTVDHLLHAGFDVAVLDNLQPRVHPHGKPSYLPDEVRFSCGDAANGEDLRLALEGIDVVFHLAAYQDYQPDFSSFIHTNAESTALLFEIIARDRLPVQAIVFASSQSVAGEGLYSCGDHGVLTPGPRSPEQLALADWEPRCPICSGPLKPELIPESVAQPLTAYAISKHAIEHLASRLGARYRIPTACMRYTYVQGSRNSPYNAYSGVARRFALRIMGGAPPVCYEDGQQLRDYVNVADVARGNLLALEHARRDGDVYNVGGGRPVSVAQFAQIMLDELGSGLPVAVPGEYRVGDTRHTVSDISKMMALGWKPTVGVERNVHEFVEWLQEHDPQALGALLAAAEEEMRSSGVVRAVKG